MESRLTELKDWESKYNLLVEKIEASNAKACCRIKLDVRGTLFTVSKQTLMTMEGTYFYGLIANSDMFKANEDGTFFIERNPLVFDRILDYLMTGKLETRELTPLALEVLKDDLDYYCMPIPENLLAPSLFWDINRSPRTAQFSDNNLSVTSTVIKKGDMCQVFGNKAVGRFKVKIDNRDFSGNFRIGFSSNDKPNPVTFSHCIKYTIANYEQLYNFGDGFFSDQISLPAVIVINSSDIITVICEASKIRFEINYVSVGSIPISIASRIQNEGLFPYLVIEDSNVKITLVN